MIGRELYELLWFVCISGIFIYCVLSFFIYLQSKIKVFQYYALYNFFLLIYIFTKSPSSLVFDFLIDTNNEYNNFNWYIQIIYNCLLGVFYKEFLDFKFHFPKFNKILSRYFLIQIIISSLLFIWSFFGWQEHYKVFYYFGFLPFILGFTIYWIYLALKIPGKLKLFMIIGILGYYFFGYIAMYKSNYSFDNDTPPILYFIIGIIFESTVFATGLGYKIKLLYIEKIEAQENIIQEQKEKQSLKEKHNDELIEKLRIKEIELTKSLKESEEERVRTLTLALEKEIYTLRLESLQSQMNPHFIFNALNSIKVYLVRNDKKKAVHYLNLFARLIRKILESSHKDSVTLEEELKTLELYVNIENIRFEKEINFSIENAIHLSLNDIHVPGLILQPFIENAIWHGLATKKGEKNITLSFHKRGNEIILKIQDNGIGRERAKKHVADKSIKKESIGLLLVNERILIFNKKQNTDYRFKIIDLKDRLDKPSGTLIEFIFKKQNNSISEYHST